MVSLRRTTSADPDFTELTRQLDAELWARYDAIQAQYEQFNIIENNRHVVIAYVHNEPAGCGCFKLFNATTIEIKRMYVKPETRGRGIAFAILSELEQWARERSFTGVVLEMGHRQPEAVRLYRKCGYVPIEKYEPYVGLAESVCLGKSL